MTGLGPDGFAFGKRDLDGGSGNSNLLVHTRTKVHLDALSSFIEECLVTELIERKLSAQFPVDAS